MELDFLHTISTVCDGRSKSYWIDKSTFVDCRQSLENSTCINCIVQNEHSTRKFKPPAATDSLTKDVNTRDIVAVEDIAGLTDAKATIREAIVLPQKYPLLFTSRLACPPRGVLLYGPPGTGKTLLAKWIANSCGSSFYNISAASIMSKWIGESEKSVKAIFETARQNQPSVIFIDEIDCLLGKRSETDHEASRRIKNEFLVSLDGVDTNSRDHIVVIGATNIPWDLDEAALRRFSRKIYIPLPSPEARRELILRELTVYSVQSNTQLASLNEDIWSDILDRTTGFSGCDMKAILNEAVMVTIREAVNEGTLVPRTLQSADILKAIELRGRIEPVKADYESWNH